MVSPASRARVSRQLRCAPVIGSSPVTILRVRLGGVTPPAGSCRPTPRRGSGQADPIMVATISADIITNGSPPPGWDDPPTR